MVVVVVMVVVVELVLVVEMLPSNWRPNVPSQEILQSPFVTIGFGLAPTNSYIADRAIATSTPSLHIQMV